MFPVLMHQVLKSENRSVDPIVNYCQYKKIYINYRRYYSEKAKTVM